MRRRPYCQSQNPQISVPQRKLGRGLILALVIMGFGYVIQVNTIVAQGYMLSKLKYQIQEVNSANLSMSSRISDETAKALVAGSLVDLGFEEIKSVSYLADSASRPALAETSPGAAIF